jgi:hypothetical protein
VHIVADPVERARQVLTEHPDVDAVRVVAGTLVVDAPAAAAAELNSTLVAADIAVSHLTVQRRALEDVFLDMTSANAAGGAPGGTSSDGSPGGTTDSGSPGKASRAASESS